MFAALIHVPAEMPLLTELGASVLVVAIKILLLRSTDFQDLQVRVWRFETPQLFIS